MVSKIGTISISKIEGELANNMATSLDNRLDYDESLLAYKAVSDPDMLKYGTNT